MLSPRVLPPDVFDALELSALVFGGIGRGQCYNYDGDNAPWCVHGHGKSCGMNDEGGVWVPMLDRLGITPHRNDAALSDVPDDERVTFRQWCKRLNVVRADTPTFDPANFPPRRSAKRRSTGARSSRPSSPKNKKRDAGRGGRS